MKEWALLLLVVIAVITLQLFPAEAEDIDGQPGPERVLTVGTAADYDSINAALAAAAAGDTVLIQPGVYRERVVLNKPVILKGQANAVLDGEGQGTVLSITADGCVVEGLTVQNSGQNLKNNDAAILLLSANNSIRNNNIRDSNFGIYLVQANGNLVSGNSIRGRKELTESLRGNGIHLWNSDNNLIEGNSVYGSRDGLYFSYADNNVIRDNLAYGLRYGVHYMYSNNNLLAGNSLKNNTAGAVLMFSQNNTIEANLLLENEVYGILFKDFDRNTVRNNVVKQNGTGIYLPNAVKNKVYGNLLQQNTTGVYLTGGAEDNIFYRNVFLNNDDQAKSDGNSHNFWSEQQTGNYWSDYRGFDVDGDGIGEMPYRETNLVQSLLERNSMAKLLLYAPVMQLLALVDNSLPVLLPRGVIDNFPLLIIPEPFSAL